MLQRLKLKDFQAYSDFEIEFDPHITVITGTSDVGKSTLLRALWWVCSNQPAGDDFIRHGRKRARVKLLVDGKTITRIKGKGVNTYAIGKKKYKAFGSNVPPEVVKLVNVTDTNYQTQFEGHFWFSKTSGEVSKQLNQIINLGKIDSVMAKLAAGTRKAKSVVEITEDRLAEAVNDQEKLAWVPGAIKDFKRLESLESKFLDVCERRDSARKLIERLRTVRQEAKRVAAVCRQAEALASAGQSARKIAKRAERLRRLMIEIVRVRKLCNLELPNLAKLEKLKADASELNSQSVNLNLLVADYTKAEDKSCRAKRLLSEAEGKLKRQLKRKLKGKCPVCGQTISRPSRKT